MKRGKKARRPARRTARAVSESLPGPVAFYSDVLEHSTVDGHAQLVRGRPHFVAAYGTIESNRCFAERVVVFDARAVLRVRAIRGDLGRERCDLLLLDADGREERIVLDVPCLPVAALVAKARG
jgi:hypothetical protein